HGLAVRELEVRVLDDELALPRVHEIILEADVLRVDGLAIGVIAHRSLGPIRLYAERRRARRLEIPRLNVARTRLPRVLDEPAGPVARVPDEREHERRARLYVDRIGLRGHFARRRRELEAKHRVLETELEAHDGRREEVLAGRGEEVHQAIANRLAI